MKLKSVLAALALTTAALSGASAQAAAYGFISAPDSYDTQLSLGFTFTANKTVTIRNLGYYDAGGDGFLTSHDVGIYLGDGASGPGALLASTTLAPGASGFLGANDFRYKAITPLTLIAGQIYTIAGLSPNVSGNDAWVYGGPGEIVGFTVDPAITIGLNAGRYIYNPPGGVLTDPNLHYSDYQVYAVNFNGSPVGVPEPAAWAMMLVGFGGLGGVLRRSRRERNSAVA